MISPTSEHTAHGAAHDAWIDHLTVQMAELSPAQRQDWDSIKQVIRTYETELFEPNEQFADGSLLADSWYTLLVQQLKIPRTVRLAHDDLCGIRRLLRQYHANAPATLEHVHRLTFRAEDLFHSGQLVQSEAIMSLFRPPKAVRLANQRQLVTNRVTGLLTESRVATEQTTLTQPDDTASERARSLAERIDNISQRFGVALVVAQDLFDDGEVDVEATSFPSVVRSIPGLATAFSGAIRPFRNDLTDEALLSRIRRARQEYRRQDQFRDVVYLFYSAALTALRTPLDSQMPAYFRWIQGQLDTPIATLISDLHERSAYGGESFVGIVREVAEGIEYATQGTWMEMDDSALVSTVHDMLSEIDWSQLVVGEYDFIRLFADYAGDVPHDDPQTCAKLARLI